MQSRDLGTRVRKIIRRGRFELAGGRNAVGRVTGHHLVNRRRVVEQARRRVAHRADQRRFVHLLGKFRHDFAQPYPRNLRAQRFEFAADIGRRFRFRVPDVEVARPALEEEQDDRFGFAPTGFGFGGVGRRFRGERLQFQNVAQTHAEQAGAADANELATAPAVARATGISRDR